MWLKIKEFIKAYESEIILVAGFILVAILSFEAGMLKGQKIQQNPVVVKTGEDQAVCGINSEGQIKAPEGQNLAQEGSKNTNSQNMPIQGCAYAGSKNSNKYHLPNCRWAKNIKPENLICFKDKNEAESKGYQADKNCIK